MSGDLEQVLAELIQRKLGQVTGDGQDESAHRPLSGLKGVAAGAAVAAAAPLAAKSLPKVLGRLGVDGLGDLASAPLPGLGGLASRAGERVGSTLGEKLEGKLDEAGGPSGILKDTFKSVLAGGGSDDQNGSDGVPGVGKGRRMPVQQTVDIGLPLETVYNQFTQFEMWPQFMHRVVRVNQEDDCTLGFATRIWGRTKEFTVEIETQRPDQRIKWHTTGGMSHVGVVTFHEVGPNLTRVLVGMDLDPGGMLEKMARGMRFLKRAVRADLHRFKALIESSEQETGAWRGVIEDGEVVQQHDTSYDKEREYSDPDEVLGKDEGDSGEDDSGGRASARRGSSAPASRASQSRSPRSTSSKSGSSRSGSSKSGSSRSGSSKSSSSRSGSSKSSSSRSGSSKSTPQSKTSRASSKPSRQQRRTSASDKPRARKTTTSRRRGATNGGGTGSKASGQGRSKS